VIILGHSPLLVGESILIFFARLRILNSRQLSLSPIFGNLKPFDSWHVLCPLNFAQAKTNNVRAD
jgi:hypothetical protein